MMVQIITNCYSVGFEAHLRYCISNFFTISSFVEISYSYFSVTVKSSCFIMFG